jgi:hypothetical protein
MRLHANVKTVPIYGFLSPNICCIKMQGVLYAKKAFTVELSIEIIERVL